MVDAAPNMENSGCAKVALWTFGILVALVLLGAIAGKPQSGEDEGTKAIGQSAAYDDLAGEQANDELSEIDEPTSDWRQFDTQDELRGTINSFAVVTSQNSVRFDFPYCCNSRLSITVRNTSQYGQDVIFQISDGQFVCGIYDCQGMISFDGKAERLSLNRSADNDSKVLFAKYPRAIIDKLKTSESVIVELPFYQEGNQQFKFKTKGLNWK